MKQGVLLILLAVALLAGCAADEEGEILIVFSAGRDPSGATATLIEEYNAAHPGVRVEFQEMPENTDTQHDQYVTYLSAGETSVDIYALDVIWTAEFARAGWIEPLPDGFVSADEFLAGPLESVTYQSTLYGVPWFTDAGVLYYRKDLLDEAGLPVPTTWDEFRDACRQVALPRGMDGFVWQGARYEGLVCNFLEFLWSLGGSIDGETLATDPVGAEEKLTEAIELAISFFDDGISKESVLTYKEEDSRRIFTEGDALFHRNWPYAWSMAEGEESKINGLVGIAPLMGAPGEIAHSTIGGWNLALSSYSDHQDEALEFLAFITGERAQKLRTIEGGYLPTRKSTYADADVLAANPHFGSFFEVFRSTRNRPRSPHYPRVSDVIQENVHAAFSREIAPEDAARAIVVELADLMTK